MDCKEAQAAYAAIKADLDEAEVQVLALRSALRFAERMLDECEG